MNKRLLQIINKRNLMILSVGLLSVLFFAVPKAKASAPLQQNGYVQCAPDTSPSVSVVAMYCGFAYPGTAPSNWENPDGPYDGYLYLQPNTTKVVIYQSNFDDCGYDTFNLGIVHNTYSPNCNTTSYQIANVTASTIYPGENNLVQMKIRNGQSPAMTGSMYFYVYHDVSAPAVSITSDGHSGGTDPDLVGVGKSVSLHWTISKATYCSYTGGWTPNFTENRNYSTPTDSSTSAGGFSSNTAFIISCSGPGGSTTSAAYINIISPPSAPVLNTPTISCSTNTSSPTILLSWIASSNVDHYEIDREYGAISWKAIQPKYNATSYADSSAPNNQTIDYQIWAVGPGGSTPSIYKSISTYGSGNCTPKLSAMITPNSHPMIQNSSYLFAVDSTVTAADGSKAVKCQSPSYSPFNYNWTVDSNAGTKSAGQFINQVKFTATGSPSPLPYLKALSANMSCILPLGEVINTTKAATADVSILTASQINGDVYSGGGVSNLNVGANSVVSASGSITNVNSNGITSNYQIPGYKTSNALQWETVNGIKGVKQIMSDETKILKNEHIDNSRTLGTKASGKTITGVFNLNPPVNQSYSYISGTNVDAVEGTIWYVPGDLTIQTPITFYGRGTIIVDGNVSITGNGAIFYPLDRLAIKTTDNNYALESASLGIILTASGNVTVNPTVSGIVGAYFVPNGAINLMDDPANESSFNANGLFVGNTISLSRMSKTISYDSNIPKLTPPGFGTLSLPTVTDTTQ